MLLAASLAPPAAAQPAVSGPAASALPPAGSGPATPGAPPVAVPGPLPPPPVPDPGLLGVKRMEELGSVIDRDSSASKLWFWGWFGLFSANVAVQSVLWARASEPDPRARARVGFAVGTIALVATTILPPKCLSSSRGSFTAGSDSLQQSRIIKETEEKVERCAEGERFGRSFLAHLGGVVLNGTAALYLWRHDHLPLGAAYQLASGVLVGELRIWTQPTVAMDAAEGLKQGATVSLSPVIGPGFAGWQAGGVF